MPVQDFLEGLKINPEIGVGARLSNVPERAGYIAARAALGSRSSSDFLELADIAVKFFTDPDAPEQIPPLTAELQRTADFMHEFPYGDNAVSVLCLSEIVDHGSKETFTRDDYTDHREDIR